MVRGPSRRGHGLTMRKGRGRAKPVPSSPTTPTKEKQSRFQGKLSHRTPIKNQKVIENFFMPTNCESTPVEEKQDLESPDIQTQTENEAVLVRSSPRKQTPQPCHSNGVLMFQGRLNGSSPSGHTPHKIQLFDEEPDSSHHLQDLAKLDLLQPRKPTKAKGKIQTSLECNQREKKETDADKNIMVHLRTLSEKTENTCHKLTEYYPVRRSVRKTKKTVLEEEQRNLEDCVLSQREDGLKVLNFEGKGRGVVTTRKFHRGEFVVEYCGELIDMVQAKVREEDYAQDQNTGCYMYYFKYKNNQYCIDATAESGRLGRLVNHSRNGNLITKITSVGGVPHLVLIAKDDIESNQEVSYDYGDRTKESLKYHPWLAS